jgi:GH15 family glucan-1,4-alpha-glucosidase
VTTREGYLPIEDHGLIGNHHTVALVGIDGTIDWFCCPRFDSPSLFGSLLDKDKGGHFRIAPEDGNAKFKQFYFPDTNCLITRFLTEDGVGEVIDFMPVDRPGELIGRHRLVRWVRVVRGQMRFRVEVEPRFDYARERHKVEPHPHGIIFETPRMIVALASKTPLERTRTGACARFVLSANQSATFMLEPVEEATVPRPLSPAVTGELATETVAYWRAWLARSNYRGRWREMVNRSALTLKLLTYKPTGAIVAAPTTSLPEQMGGPRNWDYRYTWIRDSAFSLHSLLLLGFTDAAEQFMSWLTDRFREMKEMELGRLQVMYRVDGSSDLEEEQLDHLEGYRGSRPVRIGNSAATQLQLDIYGELIDSIYVHNRYGGPIYYEAWEDLRAAVEWLCANWDQPDEGIWETRGGKKDFTYSRLQSWVGIDRAMRISQQRSLPSDIVKWRDMRNAIHAQINERGWKPARDAFVQHYDDNVLDASLLLMPLVKFVAPTDPRWLSTLDSINRELVTDSLVHRYNPEVSPDGLQGTEGTFSMCSFWLVEAMSRAGQVDEARLIFEKMLTYANHVGLYSEQIGPTGEALGNFPQAFTHLALISAAFDLDRALG